jgi:hypothetical protein
MRYIFLFICFLGSTAVVFAQGTEGYVPIVGVPGLEQAGGLTAQQYVEALYKLSIAIGAMLAVIQIIFAGVQYMFTDVITSKSDAISRIWGALWGLVILLGAVLILQTVNPDLLNLNIFSNAPSIDNIKGVEPKKPTPAKIGDSATSFNPQATKNIIDTCKTAGGAVGSEQQAAGKGGRMTVTTCYPSASSVRAKVGTSFSPTDYAPQERKDAEDSFKKSCSSDGGQYKEGFFSGGRCEVFAPEEEIGVGDTPSA